MQVSRPVISNVYENQSATYENIVVPFTDGIKQVQVQANLKKSYESNGREVISSLEKGVTLNMIDDVWKEHLREMDELRQSVQSAVYEQKDPLLIYKFESFELFNKMLDKVNKDIISFLMRANLPKSENTQVKDAASVEQRPELAQIKTSRTEIPQFENQTFTNAPGQEQEKPKTQPVRVDKKVGRNELCPCGSGKKFKHCHGKGNRRIKDEV
jgi:preprotein translocase subunit SecA